MKKNKLQAKCLYALFTSLVIGSAITGCDSDISFNATRADNDKIPAVSANLTATQTGSSIVRVPSLNSLPDDLKNANDIQITFDNSKTLIPVSKSSDGSLSFSLASSVRIDSEGKFNVIFIVNNQKSYLVTLKTGPVLKLKTPGILVTPATGTVIKGEKTNLKANVSDEDKDKFIFNWFYGSSASGPFLPISGTSDIVEWTPGSVGNYFIKLDMLDKSSGISSTYISPVSQVFVTDANNIITVSPSSGTVLRGKQTSLSINIPNADPTKFDYTWSYSQGAQGPFLTISGNSKTVNWTPNNSGSFYLKVDALNKDTQETSTYTSTEALVFVTENENIIQTTPSLGNIIRGDSIKVSANVPVNGDSTYSWAYSQTLNGPWQSIPGTAKEGEWTPPVSGSFYIKIDVVDKQSNNVSTFISPKAIVFVSEANNVFKTDPLGGNIKRGKFVTLTADIPGSINRNYQFNWSYSASGQNLFQPVSNISGNIKSNVLKWRPPNEGSYIIKVDAINVDTQSVVSFTSPTPIVFVNELTPLFTTKPEVAKITQDSSVDIMADLDIPSNSVFAWSFGPGTNGPWTSIGGSLENKITWDKKGKPVGTYYVKVDLTDSGDKSISTFVSRTPIIFVDQSEQASNSATFGR